MNIFDEAGMIERRKFVRIPKQVEILYKVLPNTDVQTSLTKDIGQGGIGFYSKEYIPEGSRIEIKLGLKEILLYFVVVVVVKWVKKDDHSDGYNIGAEFTNLPIEAVEKLVEYIQQVSSETK